MEPKEKAKELVEKFKANTRIFEEMTGWVDDVESAKQCALICVDEIMRYWDDVKTEITKL